MQVHKVVGKPLPRVDAVEKVTGRAIFGEDVSLPGMLHGKLLRSPYAHAIVKRIDTSRAAALPGVALVLTGDDLAGLPETPSARHEALLARGRVVFCGQPVAAVVAADPDTAEEALDLIAVEYEELPATVDVLDAMKPGAPSVRLTTAEADRGDAGGHVTIEGAAAEDSTEAASNISAQVQFSRGDVDQGLADSDAVVERSYRVAWVHQGYVEPHVAVADYRPTGHLTVWTSTQGQFYCRQEIAGLFKIPESRIRIVPTEIGGGFGGKISLLPPLATLLSMKAGRPVKVVMSRSEDLRAGNPSPGGVFRLKLGVKQDGRMMALKAEVILDSGAFPASPVTSACLLLGGYYRIPNIDVRGWEVLTHKPSAGAYRAPGVFQSNYAIESTVDEAARSIGMDPIDFRLLNVVDEGDPMPHGRPWPRMGAKSVLQRMKEHPIWQRRGGGANQGIGVSLGCWLGGLQPASASVMVDADGSVRVVVGSVDLSGSHTAHAQIAAEVLDLPIEQINIATADTSRAPFAGMSGGSKIVYTVGAAVKKAAEDAREQLIAVAAAELGADPAEIELGDGTLRVRSEPSKSLTFAELGQRTTAFAGQYPPIHGRGSAAQRRQSPGFTVQIAEVAVDPETGQVTVTRYAAAQDVGFAINPLAVQGQIQGAVGQGMAMALLEELIFDDRGRLLNPNLLDYRQPTALDVPAIEAVIVEVPSPDGPYGARGVGEPGITAGSAAIANAIYDAVGVRLTELPMTPERILKALPVKRAVEPEAIPAR
ncbi:MAG: xanthine dehydrogenase family protein molybdopterin-binding subunit [Chloroflexi bacterium]|nr:xanthine dehydrogenase family protein molybdopterin-binding subunit [Chloroflexota bacterium]